MNRDHIKIVEFDMDGEKSPAPATPGAAAMNIVETDNDQKDHRPRVATAKDIGPIKIIEFDDDAPPAKSRAPEAGPEAPRKSRAPGRTVGPIKIIEFDKEQDAYETVGGAPKIKIMEFD